MATYATDLTTIVDFDGTPSSPTVAEPASGWTAGRSPTTDTDFPIQSSNHASLTMNTTGKAGILCTNASSFTWTSGDYLFGWIIWLAPGAIATQANGGLAMLCGSGVSDYKVFYVGGSDYGLYPYGGWQNFAVDPTLTYDEIVGSPTAYYVVGAGANVLSQVSKGNPLGFDVFRYGRGEFQVTGTSATFSGMAAANDATTARWGLFQAIAGGYKWKGLMSLGLTGTSVSFTDSNKSIVIDDQLYINSNFNAIEINNASSVVSWTNISITNLCTISKGTFAMIANADVTLTDCTFTDMNTFVFQSNADISGTTFRRCGLVTQGSAPFDGCIFASPSGTVGLLANNLNTITNTTFTSDGTGHAIEIGGTATDYTLTNLIFNGYSGTSTDAAIYVNISSGSMTLTISGGTVPSIRTAGATVTVNSDVITTLTGLKDNTEIRVYPAATYPASFTINNISGTAADLQSAAAGDMPVLEVGDEIMLSGCGTSTNNVKWTVSSIVTDGQEYRCTISTGTPTTESGISGVYVNPITELAGTDNATDGTTNNRTYSFSLPASTDVDYVIYNINYQPIYSSYTITSTNASIPIQQQTDRWYYDEPG